MLPKSRIASADPTIAVLRGNLSAMLMPTRAPAVLPKDIRVENQSDWMTVKPCFTKNDGSQATNPYTETRIAMHAIEATAVRAHICGPKSSESGAGLTWTSWT